MESLVISGKIAQLYCYAFKYVGLALVASGLWTLVSLYTERGVISEVEGGQPGVIAIYITEFTCLVEEGITGHRIWASIIESYKVRLENQLWETPDSQRQKDTVKIKKILVAWNISPRPHSSPNLQTCCVDDKFDCSIHRFIVC